jgi:hypothetical protein
VLEGCDVSHWNAVGHYHGDYVYAKATQGLGYEDPKFGEHKASIKAHGLVFLGGYHFAETSDGVAQFNHFHAVSPDGLAILDWESYESGGTWHKASVATVEAWLAAAKARGRTTALYGTAGDVHSVTRNVDVRIIAAYGSQPSKPWEIWQYQGIGLDLDRYDGTLAQLKKLAGTPAPPPPPKKEDDMLSKSEAGAAAFTFGEKERWMGHSKPTSYSYDSKGEEPKDHGPSVPGNYTAAAQAGWDKADKDPNAPRL